MTQIGKIEQLTIHTYPWPTVDANDLLERCKKAEERERLLVDRINKTDRERDQLLVVIACRDDEITNLQADIRIARQESDQLRKEQEEDVALMDETADVQELAIATIQKLTQERDQLRARVDELEKLLQSAEDDGGTWAELAGAMQDERDQLRDSLAEILDYTGGANSALEDEYVIDRALRALNGSAHDSLQALREAKEAVVTAAKGWQRSDDNLDADGAALWDAVQALVELEGRG